MQYNASEDSSASGTGSITLIDPADQWTSIGSDYSIQDTAADIYYAVNSGQDLGTTDGAHLTIDNYDVDAAAVNWSIGAFQGQGLGGSVPRRRFLTLLGCG